MSLIIRGISLPRDRKLPHLANALHPLGVFTHVADHGQKQPDQADQDAQHHQYLDKRKSATRSKLRQVLSWTYMTKHDHAIAVQVSRPARAGLEACTTMDGSH